MVMKSFGSVSVRKKRGFRATSRKPNVTKEMRKVIIRQSQKTVVIECTEDKTNSTMNWT